MVFSFISNLWNKWNIQGFVILSLSLQVFLILFAPLRKKTKKCYISFLLWLAYLMADWVAAFAIGLLSHSQGVSWAREAKVDKAIQAFWASFLLLHLGGPDTITAFSLEDSLLWPRHLLSIIFQVGAAIYVFVHIFPSDKSLVIATMLVFLAGIIKNVERLLALNLSSIPRLSEIMLLQQDDFADAEKELTKDLRRDGHSNEKKEILAESIVVKHAYHFYRIFKFFSGEVVFSTEKFEMTREYFSSVLAVDALRVISVQLHFIYEVLHTKALIIHSKWSYVFRFVAFTNVVIAFFQFNRKKHQFNKLDVEITHILLFGGIALDMIALLLLFFSDWTIAKISWYKTGSTTLDSFLHRLLSAMADLRKPRFPTYEAESNAKITYAAFDTLFIFRRCSESISACNLLSEILQESPRKMHKCNKCWVIIAFSNICSFPVYVEKKILTCFHQASEMIVGCCGLRNMKWMIANTKYASKNPFITELWAFIFAEVKQKSTKVRDLNMMKEIFDARGDMFLHSKPGGFDCCYLLEYVAQYNDGFSILTWHFATELCYNREKQSMSREREFSKILSDYMLYLCLNHPHLVSPVGGVSKVTSASALLELKEHIPGGINVEDTCKILYEDKKIFEGLSSTSPLRKGIELAQKMEDLEETKWKVMTGVWVEMLSYAAGHNKVEAHLQVLSKGGELLAFVWLLMVHFGFVNYQGDISMPIADV